MSAEVRGTGEAGVNWVNQSGVESAELNATVGRVAREISSWVQTIRGADRPSIFNRAAYVAPDNPYALMETASTAVENDDIVGGVADVTEGLMLQGLKWEASNADDADVFNQISRDLNLDDFVRQWHREEFKYDQVIVGVWWGYKTYTVRGKTSAGNKRKKNYSVVCPVALTFLNPMKVVPLSPGPFGQERLAWRATKEEYASVIAMGDGQYGDAVLSAFTNGPVPANAISVDERRDLVRWHIDPDRLLWLNPASVFRACRTKMTYERFPAIRLKSVFPLLDLKQQLMESDRVSLVGAANYLLLVKQGSPEEPAMQEEIDNLKENFSVVAKLPVIIGDHRLNIEIITPDQEFTLQAEKYDTLDRRILGRTLGTLTVASNGQRNESTVTIARAVGRLLENRRHMMKRTLEEQLARAVVNHPANAGVFDDEPNLVFSPRNVQLDNDAAMTQAILALRTQNELSRESTLEYFGFDQMVEALRREFEDESGLDDTFQTRIPFSAGGDAGDGADGSGDQAAESSQVAGARGGRPAGGGQSKKSVQGSVKNRTSSGNPSTAGGK